MFGLPLSRSAELPVFFAELYMFGGSGVGSVTASRTGSCLVFGLLWDCMLDQVHWSQACACVHTAQPTRAYDLRLHCLQQVTQRRTHVSLNGDCPSLHVFLVDLYI